MYCQINRKHLIEYNWTKLTFPALTMHIPYNNALKTYNCLCTFSPDHKPMFMDHMQYFTCIFTTGCDWN